MTVTVIAAVEWSRVLLLQDYNTRVVLLGTVLLGLSGGVVGALMVLRKRALVADVASHAALPGIGAAFLMMEWHRSGTGKWLPGLLLGATVSAAAGLLVSQGLRRIRRIKEDAALGITLSLFFGLGVVLLTWIQSLPTGNAAGLNEFIFGKAAALVSHDIAWIAGASATALLIVAALHKEFGLLCFDAEYARAGGWPDGGLDLLLTALVVMIAVVGMQSVGLLLVVALMVLPTTAARFWTDRFGPLLWLSGALGGLSAAIGVALSALVPNFAAGAVIVLSGTLVFAASLLFGRRRGVWWRWRETVETRRHIAQADLLRACYEVLEPQLAERDDLTEHVIALPKLQAARSWSAAHLRRLLTEAENDGVARCDAQGHWRLTAEGRRAAVEAVRRHRLWELYLIHYADVAPQLVDRNADALEHALQPEAVEQLERLLDVRSHTPAVPVSPHAVAAVTRSPETAR